MKPILFLDFDRTLIDTDRFYVWLGDSVEKRISQIVNREIEPPNFADYLYADTIHFLQVVKKRYYVALVTYGVNLKLQEIKLKGSGIAHLFDDIIMTSGDNQGMTGKGSAIKKNIIERSAEKLINFFVDDASQNIDEVKNLNKDVRCIRIDRSLLPQAVTDDVVANLDELLIILQV